MGNVYTQLLYEVFDAPLASHFSDLVPDGVLWVVTDIDAAAPNLQAVALQGLYISSDLGAPILWVPRGTAVGSYVYQWSGRSVVNTGESIQVEPGEAGWSWRITGFALSLP